MISDRGPLDRSFPCSCGNVPVAVVPFPVDDAHVVGVPSLSSPRKVYAARRASVPLDVAKVVGGFDLGTTQPGVERDFVGRAVLERRGQIGAPVGYRSVPRV